MTASIGKNNSTKMLLFFFGIFSLVPCLHMAFLVATESEPLWIVPQGTEVPGPGRSLWRALCNSCWIALDGPQIILPCLAARALPQQMGEQERHFPAKIWFCSPHSPTLPVWQDALGMGAWSICACSWAICWALSLQCRPECERAHSSGLACPHSSRKWWMSQGKQRSECSVWKCKLMRVWAASYLLFWLMTQGLCWVEGLGICSSTAEHFDYRNSSYKEVIGTSSSLMSTASRCKSLHQWMPPFFPPFNLLFFI